MEKKNRKALRKLKSEKTQVKKGLRNIQLREGTLRSLARKHDKLADEAQKKLDSITGKQPDVQPEQRMLRPLRKNKRYLVAKKMQLGLVVDYEETYRSFMQTERGQKYPEARTTYREVTEEADQRYIYVSNKVRENIQDIKFSENISLIPFADPSMKKTTFLMDDRFFRYSYANGIYYVLHGVPEEGFAIDQNKQIRVFWTTFTLHTDTDNIHSDNSEYSGDLIEEFLRLLTFYLFAEHETIDLKPNQSHGTRKDGKVLNESDIVVTVLNSLWHKTIIVQGEFEVRGHWRLQAYGTGRSEHKLIYIKPFKKKGYKRTYK